MFKHWLYRLWNNWSYDEYNLDIENDIIRNIWFITEHLLTRGNVHDIVLMKKQFTK